MLSSRSCVRKSCDAVLIFLGGKWRRMAETKWYLARSSHQSGAVWLALARNVRLCWNYLARSGAQWRHVAQNLIGATWRAPLHSSGFQKADCLRHLVPLGGHFAPIFRCKWRDENFKHFKIFSPPN